MYLLFGHLPKIGLLSCMESRSISGVKNTQSPHVKNTDSILRFLDVGFLLSENIVSPSISMKIQLNCWTNLDFETFTIFWCLSRSNPFLQIFAIHEVINCLIINAFRTMRGFFINFPHNFPFKILCKYTKKNWKTKSHR